MRAHLLSGRFVVDFLQKLLEDAQAVVPEGIDLHGLATAGSDHPSIDLGIHPRELIALRSLGKQPVNGIDVNVEEGAAQVMLDDVAQPGHHSAHGLAIAGDAPIAPDGVEEPQRGVGRVIQPIVLPFRKEVGDEPVPDVRGERAQDVARLAVPSRGEGQPFEADHRVAAPVREPVITGDDRPRFVA